MAELQLVQRAAQAADAPDVAESRRVQASTERRPKELEPSPSARRPRVAVPSALTWPLTLFRLRP